MTLPDIQGVLNLALQLVGTSAGGLAIWIFWHGVQFIQGKLHLQNIAISDGNRAIINAGIKNAIGYAIALQQKNVSAQGKSLTDLKGNFSAIESELVNDAAEYLEAHYGDTLKIFGVDTTQIKAMIRAQLGLAALDAASPTAPDASAVPAADPKDAVIAKIADAILARVQSKVALTPVA